MTAAPLKHVDPNDRVFRTSLKEAVIEGIVRRSHDRLTGRGELGKIVMNDPPTKLFAAGFLLPAVRRSSTSEGMTTEAEITSPIHIATVGMSFQIARDFPGTLEVKPEGSVYVRILPDRTDMEAAGMTFGLRSDLRRAMRLQRSELVQARLLEAKLGSRGENDEQRQRIADIRRDAQRQAFLRIAEQENISTEIVKSARTDAIPSADPVAVAMAGAAAARGEIAPEDVAVLSEVGEAEVVGPDNDRSTMVWTIKPGHIGPLPDDRLVEPMEFPQKWLRLNVEWPVLSFDPSWSRERVWEECLQHADAMQHVLNERLNIWLAADDRPGELGGRLWAMPLATNQSQTHKVLPSQVVNWDAHLEALRSPGSQKAVPTLKLLVEVRITDDPLDNELRTARIILANRSPQVDPSRVPGKLHDTTLYLAGLRTKAPTGLHRDHVLERVRPSYRWNEWLEHSGLGINCGLICERPDDGGVVLRTTHMPQWRQPRIVPHDISPRPTFDLLSAEDGGIGVARALVKDYEEWIEKKLTEEPWRITSAGYSRADECREKLAFEEDVELWRSELDRICRGLRILEECVAAIQRGKPHTDPAVAPLRAWRATNAAFLRVQRDADRRRVFAPSSWRLFQLAFLLSHLPGVVSRMPGWCDKTELFTESMEQDDAKASLLYFPTGGGKSEAFFGLLVLQSFVDRLRGKRRGVSAIVRYPLRLLTSQQANRFARVLAMAELERLSDNIPGAPFQIGFWVGGGNTPNFPSPRDGFNDLPRWDVSNLTSGAEERLQKDDKGYRSVGKWRRLTECPFCGSKPVALRRRLEGATERLAHACVSATCEWNQHHGGPEPLPFHVMDTDIYAYAPTILLGTVDKMAAIAQNPNTIARVFGMFGFAPWMLRRLDDKGRSLPGDGRLEHPRRPSTRPGTQPSDAWADPAKAGCVPIGPVFGNIQVELFDPFPAIEVQDEAHLLEQSLGTFSGLFGSILETAFADLAPLLGTSLSSRLPNGRPRRVKVIAASATVQGPERQIRMLYQRHVGIFPHPGPDLYESFFARLEASDPTDLGRSKIANAELKTPTRRLYISMPTNGRPHTSATVSVLSALHLSLTELYQWMSSTDPAKRFQARTVLADALPDGALRGIHHQAIIDATDDQIAEAIDLARIVLCYVTSKKGGDSVQAALSEFVPRDHQRAGVDIGATDGVETGLITGSIEIDAIQAVVERTKPEWKAGDPVRLEADFLGALRGIVATSAISHGVDVERLNLMVFAGLPSDVAEYVQASSRVGRTHVGASILVPTPQRVRDVHVVGIHDVFHRFLERMVQPAAVDRWGENAIDRVVASAVQVMSCAVGHYTRLCGATGDDARRRLWDSSGVNRLRGKAVTDLPSASEEMRQFLMRAIGIEDGSAPLHDATKLKFGPPEDEWYEQLLQRKVRDILYNIRQETYAQNTLRTFWNDTHRPDPMTSLRDVDEAGVLVPASKSIIDNRPMPRDLGALMRRLRHGDGAWAEGEGDTDTAVEEGT